MINQGNDILTWRHKELLLITLLRHCMFLKPGSSYISDQKVQSHRVAVALILTGVKAKTSNMGSSGQAVL